jgi:hypothetical protein
MGAGVFLGIYKMATGKKSAASPAASTTTSESATQPVPED